MLQRLMFFLFLSLFAGYIASADASINLKKVQITGGDRVELVFDGKIESNQIKTEFVRDIVQLSLSNVSVYPAKVSLVSGSDLTKVFAYQYSPNLVRARFSVKGDAEEYRNRIQIKADGKVLSLKLAPAAKTAAKVDPVITTASVASTPKIETLNSEEKVLLDRVTKNEKKKTLTSGKDMPSPFRSIGVMLVVFGLLGLFALYLKKIKDKKSNGLGQWLGKFTGQKPAKDLIEVIATHHLAPKKSILLVKIQRKTMVLGMTNDSLHLISELKTGSSDDADSLDVVDFAESLKKFESDAPMQKLNEPKIERPLSKLVANSYQQTAQKQPPAGASVAGSPAYAQMMKQDGGKPTLRAQIKSRMEGMKQL